MFVNFFNELLELVVDLTVLGIPFSCVMELVPWFITMLDCVFWRGVDPMRNKESLVLSFVMVLFKLPRLF